MYLMSLLNLENYFSLFTINYVHSFKITTLLATFKIYIIISKIKYVTCRICTYRIKYIYSRIDGYAISLLTRLLQKNFAMLLRYISRQYILLFSIL